MPQGKLDTVKPRNSAALALAGIGLLVGAGCGSSTPRAASPRTTTVGSTLPPLIIPPAPTTQLTVIIPPASGTRPTTTAAATGIPAGPGPQVTYTVEPQPAPGSCHYSYVGTHPLPDPTCTPGATNPQVAQVSILDTICEAGYTASIRPPPSITDAEKQQSAAAYGYTGSFSTAEYDHLIPLELGGDPNDPANLWVEPNDNPKATSVNNRKDVLETRLKDLVCAERVPLATAQQAIATNWVSAYQLYVG